jgi:hypothetical protein
MYREFLKWWPDYGYTERTDLVTVSHKTVTTVQFPNLLTFEKPPPQVVFSFSEKEITL